MKDYIGTTIQNYRIDALLGEGGMGAVFQAIDLNLARTVALKVMHSNLGRSTQFQQRFLQEARAAGRLNHPSIVSIYHFGAQDDLLYLVMQYIAGGTLREYLSSAQREGRAIDLGETLRLVAQAADALGYAHQAGIIHRDVKPDNLLLEVAPRTADPDEIGFRVILTDFGLAKLVEGGIQTSTGTFMGTLPYMSPEQCLGQTMDGRSDIYALGVLLYQLVLGSLPFDIRSPTDAVLKHQHEAPPDPLSIQPALPANIAEIILHSIAKSPEQRFQKADDMAAALRNAAGRLEPEEISQLAPPGTELLSLATQLQVGLASAPGRSLLDRTAPKPSPGEDQIQILAKGKPTVTLAWQSGGMTVGRSDENDITLNDSKVSRRHARIDQDPSGFQVTDLGSANGTYLGDQRLLPQVPERWSPGSAIRIGSHWLRLFGVQGSRSTSMLRPDGTAIEGSLIQTSSGEARVAVYLKNSKISIDPGAELDLKLAVLNQSAVVDHFGVRVDGLPENWITLPERIQLLPGSQKDALVRIAPPRAPDSRAGRHPFRVIVGSEDSPGQTAIVEGILTVGSFGGYEAQLHPEIARAGQTIQVTIQNQGNIDEAFVISLDDPAQELAFEPGRPELRVEAGGTATASFQAKPASTPLIGGGRRTRYQAVIQPAAGDEKALAGEITSRGRLPVWVLPAVIFACVLLSAGGWLAFQNVRGGRIEAEGTSIAAITQTAEALVLIDTDGDGLTNVTEVELGTDPTRLDTDGDGLSDGVEAAGCTLPLDPDTDQDGLVDGEEARLSADPCVADTDGDNLSDGQEVELGTNPANPDTDGDGSPDNVDPNPGQLPTGTPSPTLTPTSTLVPSETPTITPTPTPDITSSLLAYFPFDGDLADVSSSGYLAEWWEDADCRSFVTDRDGFAEKAAGIDICPGNSPSPPFDFGLIESDHVHFNNQFTIAGWFWNDSPGGNPVWLVGQAGWYALYLRRGDAELRFGLPNSTGPEEAFVTDPDTFGRNVWTYLTLVVSSDGSDSIVTLYRDSQEVDSAAFPGFTFSNPGSEQLHVGATLLNEATRLYMYRGAVDDLSIYGRALSPSEVAFLFANGGRPFLSEN